MDYRKNARRARIRLSIIAVAVVALLVGGVLLLTGGGESSKKESPSAAKTPTSPSPSPSRLVLGRSGNWTPATARHMKVPRSRGVKDGVSVGFHRGSIGALMAAVRHQQELDILDDSIARRQMEAIVSRDSKESVDKYVSQVRKTREKAGLPPSGGTPAGVTFTTQVKAARMRSVTDDGNVLEVWMAYDQYASLPGKATDEDPLKDQTTHVIYKWEGDDWKLTEEPKYVKETSYPHAWDPDSRYAWADDWRLVDVE
ncbi:hypothetical protein ABT104_01060 [Streptomyces mobaraensis]|uniref:hypothetical protein n=1 Tax=Streptomyces mobaraensis TaxID=35621 RepID=UPI00332FF5F4